MEESLGIRAKFIILGLRDLRFSAIAGYVCWESSLNYKKSLKIPNTQLDWMSSDAADCRCVPDIEEMLMNMAASCTRLAILQTMTY
ncbi:hypothetical protein AcV7_004077 [Taiwanofungus camphoratus]|nr:hypothetical protein AcV7_004077 [Antrodia cinnamomea]